MNRVLRVVVFKTHLSLVIVSSVVCDANCSKPYALTNKNWQMTNLSKDHLRALVDELAYARSKTLETQTETLSPLWNYSNDWCTCHIVHTLCCRFPPILHTITCLFDFFRLFFFVGNLSFIRRRSHAIDKLCVLVCVFFFASVFFCSK